MDEATTLILTHNDVARVAECIGVDTLMREMIDRLHEAFSQFSAAEFEVPVRSGFHYRDPHPGLVEWMPLLRRADSVFIKTVGYHPSNPAVRRLPTVNSTFNLFSATTGRLVAVVDGTLLTALRTGAASAVATRLLTDLSKPIEYGIIGCGAQAVSQLHGLLQIADISMIRIFDADDRVSQTFADRVSAFNQGRIPIRITSPDKLVAASDVLCTATSVEVGEGPVFGSLAVRPHLHINAVGSDLPGKTEVPLELLRQSLVCPDFPSQAMLEGECQQLSPEEIGPSIMEVAAAPEKYGATQQEKTVFDSTGWALEDYVAVQLMLGYAAELNIGAGICLSGANDDPWNPYGGIVDRVPAGVR